MPNKKLSTTPQSRFSLTVTDAAKLLGVSPDTLRNWESQGKLIPQRTDGGARRYSLVQLQPFIDQKKALTPNSPRGMLSVSKAATALGVSKDTIRNWDKKGLIPSQRTEGGARRFSKADIKRMEDELKFQRYTSPQDYGSSNLQHSSQDISVAKPQRERNILLRLLFSRFIFYSLFLGFVLVGLFLFTRFGLYTSSPTNQSKLTDLEKQIYQLATNLESVQNRVFKENSELSGDVLASFKLSDRYLEINLDTLINGDLNVNGEGVYEGPVTAPNLVYGITAGDNITITGDAQNPTISANPGANETLATVTSRGATTAENLTLTGVVDINNVLNLGNLSTDPSSANNGDTYYNTTSNSFRCYQNGSWTNCITSAGSSSGDITGVTAGNGLTGGASSGDASIAILLPTTGSTGSTNSSSGLEISSSGLTLLKGCDDGQLLSWDEASAIWECNFASAAIVADSLDFSEFKDSMTLDASTDISATGTNYLSITNTGTGNSLLVNDTSGDTTPFVIDASGSVGIGLTTPGEKLDVAGNIDLNDNSLIFGTDANVGVQKVYRSAEDVYFDTSGIVISKTNTSTVGDPGVFISYGGTIAGNLVWDDEGVNGLELNVVSSPPSGPSKISIRDATSIGDSYSSVSPPSNGLIVQGSVGIGDSTPGSKLEITGSGATSATTSLNVTNSSGSSYFKVRDDGVGAIGTESITDGVLLTLGSDQTDPAAGQYLGAYSAPTITFNTGSSFNIEDFTSAILVNGSSTINHIWGFRSSPSYNGSSTATDIVGFDSSPRTGISGTATNIYSFKSSPVSSGTITNSYGGYFGATGGIGSVTNNYGIYVVAQTFGSSDYGIRIDAADTQTLWLSGNADNTTAAAGIAFGSSRDTNLYRSAADTLKTDDALIVGTLGSASTNYLCYDGSNKLSSCSTAGGSSGFVQLQPTSAQAAASTESLIWLNESGAGSPNLLELEVGLADKFIIGNSGNIALGGTTISSDKYYKLDSTLATSSSTYGIYNLLTNSSTGSLYNINNEATVSSAAGTTSEVLTNFNRITLSGAATLSTAEAGSFHINNSSSGIISSGTSIYATVNNQSTGTITNAVSISGGVTKTSSGSITTATAIAGYLTNSNASGSIGTGYGLRIYDLTNSGTITTTYGVYVGDLTTGSQTNTPHSFYASDSNALNYFAGSTGIGDTSPDALFEILGTTEQLRISNVDGADDVRISLDSSGNLTFDGASDSNADSETLTFSGFSTLTATDITALNCTDCIDADDLANNIDLTTASETSLTFTTASSNTIVMNQPTAAAGLLDLNIATSTSDVRGLDTSFTFSGTTTGDSAYGTYTAMASSQALGSVSQSLYGTYSSVTKTGIDTSASGTINLYGVYGTASNTQASGAPTGTRNTYGGYFSSTGDTEATANAYGIYAIATGADTNYAGYFDGPSGGTLVVIRDASNNVGQLNTISSGISLAGYTSTTSNGGINLCSGSCGTAANIAINIGPRSGTSQRNITFTSDVTTAADGFIFNADSASSRNGVSISADALTSGSALRVDSTSTASTTSYLLNLTSSGAANSATRYGVYTALTGTGTTSTNTAGYFSATGATSNYAAIFENGYIGVGTTTPTYPVAIANATAPDTSNSSILNLTGTLSSTTNSQYGIYSYPTISPGSATGSINLSAGQFTAVSSTANMSSSGQLIGVGGGFYYNAASGSTLNKGVSLEAQLTNNSTGTISTAMGLQIQDLTNNGTITSTYGVYVGDITTGSQTNKYSFYASDSNATNYFSGNTSIGTDNSPDATLEIENAITTGQEFMITNTGVYTGTGIFNLTANSATSGDLLKISGTALTSAQAIDIVGPSGATEGVTDSLIQVVSDISYLGKLLDLVGTMDSSLGSVSSSVIGSTLTINSTTTSFTAYNGDFYTTNAPSTNANTVLNVQSRVGDATALANSISAFYADIPLTNNAAKTAYGFNANLSTASTTADTLYGVNIATTATGIITSDTRNIYGVNSLPTAGAESTGGTTNVYGVYSKATADVAAGGIVNAYGVYVANGTYDQDGTSTAYGLYVEGMSGADNNYAAYFGGNVGFGDSTPARYISIYDADSSTTTGQGAMILTSDVTGSEASYMQYDAWESTLNNAVTGAGTTDVNAWTTYLNTTDDTGDSQTIAGFHPVLKTFANDTAYGVLVDDATASTSGTQYGIYVNLDDSTSPATQYGAYFSDSVGIGDASPDSVLDVEGDSASNYIAQFFNDGNNSNRMGLLVQAGADDASGTNIAIQFQDGDGTDAGEITFSGGVTNYSTTSDIRLKDNITDSKIGLDDLMNLKVKDYTFKADPSQKTHTGFIAQELVSIVPDAVSVPNNPDDFWSVDYGKITPLLVSAMQEQQSQINLLKAQSAKYQSVTDPTNPLSNLSLADDGSLNTPNITTKQILLSPELQIANKEVSGSLDTLLLTMVGEVASNSTKTDTLQKDLLAVAAKADTIKTKVDDLEIKTDSLQIAANLTAQKTQTLENKIAELQKNIDEFLSLNPSPSPQTTPPPNSPTPPISETLPEESTDSAELVGLLPMDKAPSTQDLTPLDTLLASDSAMLANLNTSNNISHLEISEVFKSLGETFLGKTTVAGTLVADGTFSISNGNEINVIGFSDNLLKGTPIDSGILYLQKSSLAQGLDIFDGKVTIDKTGSIKAQSVTVAEFKVYANNITGVGQIRFRAQDTVIDNILVKPSSKILITPTGNSDVILAVTEKIEGKSFRVSSSKAVDRDITFDYFLINEVEQ